MEKSARIEQVCMIAGKMMLECGAETYRVEDTMDRIARAYGVKNPQSYASLTGINFSMGITEKNNLMRITKRETNLHKIDDINFVSRQIAAGMLTPKQAVRKLEQIEKQKLDFPLWAKIIAAGIASGSFSLMFGGSAADVLPAFIAGSIGFISLSLCNSLLEIRFLSEFFASFLLAVAAFLFLTNGFGESLDTIIIGAVMPLVPGLHITNAIRDLLHGHLIAGLSKGIETVLTSFAIGAGVAMLFAFI